MYRTVSICCSEYAETVLWSRAARKSGTCGIEGLSEGCRSGEMFHGEVAQGRGGEELATPRS